MPRSRPAPPPDHEPDRPNRFGTWIGIAVSALALLAVLFLLVMRWIAEQRGWTIMQADDWQWVRPLLALVITMVAGAWALAGIRNGRARQPLVAGLAAVAVLGLLTTGWFGYQATQHRSLDLVAYTCPGSLLKTVNAIPDPATDCTPATDAIDASIGSVEHPEMYVASAGDAGHARIDDLPPGAWKARFYATATPDIVAVSVVDTTGDNPDLLATLFIRGMTDEQRHQWAATLDVPDDVNEIALLYHVSEQPLVPSARIVFNIRGCTGQTLRSFSPEGCASTPVQIPLVGEAESDAAHTWRYPDTSISDTGLTLSNLEARTYTLSVNAANAQTASGSADLLILPAAGEQTIERAVAKPGTFEFPVEIGGSTGTLEYTIYLFPAGGTQYASHTDNALATLWTPPGNAMIGMLPVRRASVS